MQRALRLGLLGSALIAGLGAGAFAAYTDKLTQAEDLEWKQNKPGEAAALCQEILSSQDATFDEKTRAFHQLIKCYSKLEQATKILEQCRVWLSLDSGRNPNLTQSVLEEVATGVITQADTDAAHKALLALWLELRKDSKYSDPRLQAWFDLKTAQDQECLGHTEEALANYLKAAVSPDSQFVVPRALMGIAHCQLVMGKHAEAFDSVLRAMRMSPAVVKEPTFREVTVAAADKMETDLIVGRLRQCIFDNIDNPSMRDILQDIVVECLSLKGNFDEALYESRILVETCMPQNTPGAVDRLAAGLKAKDGHLARVNAFLAYQKFLKAGPDKAMGTPDDLDNPLASILAPRNEAREKQFSDALAKIPKDAAGRLRRATLLRYWGKPVDALKELKIAFALAPVDTKSLQAVTDRIVEILYQVTGDPNVGTRFVEFQKFGPPGPDGKQGTADDIENPIDKYCQ